MDRKKVEALIIGFGKGGKTLAAFLANQGMKVAVVEKSDRMYGGTCINVGCLPTKALSHSAEEAARRSPGDFGERSRAYRNALQRKDELVSLLRGKNFDNLNNHADIEVITGHASLVSASEVRVDTAANDSVIVQADKIFINTGASPIIPDIEGIGSSSRVYTSAELMELADLPRRLAIIGGGYIGLEFASMYADFGTDVTVIEGSEVFLPREDRDIAAEIKHVMEKKGVRFALETKVERIRDGADAARLTLTASNGIVEEVEADAVLVAVGRKPNVESLNLKAAGVELTERGFIRVDETLRTNVPHIWAIGDVNGGPQFSYISLDDFRIIRDHLFGGKTRSTRDRRLIPYSVFIQPAYSRVGLSEEEATRAGYKIKVATMPAAAILRARQIGKTDGILKAVVDADTNRLLGVSLFCADSSEIINIVNVFMQSGQEYTVLRDTIFTHPTMAESLNDLLSQIK